MGHRKLLVHMLLLVFCATVFTAVAHAQYRGAIRGVVTDPQGALVPGATVTLKDKETNRSLTATSDGAGIYNFIGLPPSKFSLTVEKAGFKKKEIENFGIVPEQANAVNVQLELGQATESVTVSGDAAPLLDTESSNLGGSIRAQDFQKLPSFGRDAFQLLQLAPGVFGDGARGSGVNAGFNLPGTTVGGTSSTDAVFKIENGGQITANGARTGENNYQIDGVGTTSVTWGGTSVITPNEDSIKEVKVIADNYDAENGRYRGAQVQIISKNGTNQYHGSLFLRAHRPGLNAFTRYNGYANGNSRDADRYNDWGGTAGGPLWKNKLFAFFSYETLSNATQGGFGSGWYETAAFRALAPSGYNSAAFYAFPGVGPYGGHQVDLSCAQIGLVENVNCITIPGQGLNLGTPLTIGRGLNDPGYQNSSNPGTGGNGSGGANNLDPTTPTIAYYTGLLSPSHSTHQQFNGRVDFNVTNKDLVAFSMYYVPNSSTSLNGNGDRQMNLFNTTYKNRAATLIWDHMFGSTMSNEVRVNAAGWMEKDLDQNPNAPWGLPQVGINNTGSIGINGYGIGSFNGFDQWTYAAKDVFTKIHGAHTMKMGGEFTRLLSVDAPFWSDRPGYQFNNIWDFLNDAPIFENAQLDPVTGVPSALRKDLRSIVMGLFFQDNWKVRNNLTVTAGLRWEYFGPVSEKNGKLATVEFGSGANLLSDMKIRTGGNQFNAQKANFGPQLGFTWSPGRLGGHDLNDRLVVRGGIGIAYNGIAQSNTLDTRGNPPFVISNSGLSGSQIVYIDGFPANVHSPYGYASNPAGIVTFGPNNLPTSCPTTTFTGYDSGGNPGPVTVSNGCVDLTALPGNWPTTYTYHYTLGAEYDLGHRWVASVGYQGSQTRHLTNHYNFYNPGAGRGVLLNPIVHGVTYYADDGNAHFNALLLEAKHAFSQSFQIDAQYRLSHSMDIGSNAYQGPFYQWSFGSGTGALATSDFDVKHAFKVFGIWSPTIFRGSNSWLEKIAGGWSLSGILNAHTGFPWTPTYYLGDILSPCSVTQGAYTATGPCEPVFNFGPGAGGGSADSGSGQVLPASYSGGFKPNFKATSAPNGTAYFTAPAYPTGTLFECLFPNPDPTVCTGGQQGYGALPPTPGVARNSFRGPGYFDIDATLSKSFGLPKAPILGEGAKLEIRANFYNLFNKTNMNGTCGWNGLQCNINGSNFGASGSALGARVVEFQARFSF